jgi:hypothetical protein
MVGKRCASDGGGEWTVASCATCATSPGRSSTKTRSRKLRRLTRSGGRSVGLRPLRSRPDLAGVRQSSELGRMSGVQATALAKLRRKVDHAGCVTSAPPRRQIVTDADRREVATATGFERAAAIPIEGQPRRGVRHPDPAFAIPIRRSRWTDPGVHGAPETRHSELPSCATRSRPKRHSGSPVG